MANAWDRQEGETDKAWAAFSVYLAMPVSERSIDGAFRKHLENTQKTPSKTDIAPKHWRQWAKAANWQDRARASDDWQTAEDERVTREKRNAYIAKVAELKYTDPYRRALINNALLEQVIEPILFGGNINDAGEIEAMPDKDGAHIQRLYLFGKAGETFNKDPFDIFHQTQQAIADDIPGQRIKRLDIRTLLKAMPTDELVNLIAATEGDPALSPGAGSATPESGASPEE